MLHHFHVAPGCRFFILSKGKGIIHFDRVLQYAFFVALFLQCSRKEPAECLEVFLLEDALCVFRLDTHERLI